MSTKDVCQCSYEGYDFILLPGTDKIQVNYNNNSSRLITIRKVVCPECGTIKVSNYDLKAIKGGQ